MLTSKALPMMPNHAPLPPDPPWAPIPLLRFQRNMALNPSMSENASISGMLLQSPGSASSSAKKENPQAVLTESITLANATPSTTSLSSEAPGFSAHLLGPEWDAAVLIALDNPRYQETQSYCCAIKKSSAPCSSSLTPWLTSNAGPLPKAPAKACIFTDNKTPEH